MNFDFADDLMNWLNALDSSDMEAKDVRSAVYHWALERRPAPNIRGEIARQVRLAMQDEMCAKPERRVRDRHARANTAADTIIAILRGSHRDSGRLPTGRRPVFGAPCEASQSGAAKTAHRPKDEGSKP